MKATAINVSQVAAAATRASADQQVGCCWQPRSSDFLLTIMPRGEPCNSLLEMGQQRVASTGPLNASQRKREIEQ